MEKAVTSCRLLSSAFLLLCLQINSACCAEYAVDDSGGVARQFDGIGGISGGGSGPHAGDIIIDDWAGFGRAFDGVSALSAGATSKLLVNYPEPQRSQILDYLFLPNFAASLHILKVEIGGDSQSTDGTEASHMHEEWDENYERGYEWWLMLQAKKRNPNIKLYGLPWAFPGWVAKGTNNPYKYPKLTAMYVTKWVAGAQKYYNLTIDYIGIWNERNYDIVYVKTLRSYLNAAGFSATKIVAADGTWGVAKDILAHQDFANAVDIIGVHYPGTLTTMEALQSGKTLWSSEDYSTFDNNVGGGCWARILNQNYVNGFMTSTISWNLIASYYPQLPFGGDGLMSAEQPWSGYYTVNSPIWITAHTSQFVDIGWQYLRHGSGVGKLQYGGSYVSLVDPSHQQLTIVIETMSHNHSICIRPSLPPYEVQPQNATFQLKGSFSKISTLYAWYSHLDFISGKQSILFKKVTPIKVIDGSFSLSLMVDDIVTLTTQSRGNHGNYPDPPSSQVFPLPYQDNFDGYKEFEEPYNLAPQVGVMEVRRSSDNQGNMVLRQTVLSQPIDWCINKRPVALIGDHDKWANIYIQVRVKVPSVNGSTGVFVAARVDQGGCNSDKAKGVFFFAYTSKSVGSFILSTDIDQKSIISKGDLDMKPDQWYEMSLAVQGNQTQLSFDQKTHTFTLSGKQSAWGFAAIGTSNFGLADFDNLMIKDHS